jgi:tetrapyrrole methylase family protein/MazG family protein
MHTIYVLGLGPSDFTQIPLGVYKRILSHNTLYVRTAHHPAINGLKDEGVTVHSFDSIYEQYEEDFEKVYPKIVQELKKLAEDEDILYAVPGHPMVAEKSVQLLLDEEIPVEILGGKSFIDDLFQSVSIDPVEGFQLVDAFDLHQDMIQSGQHVVVMQVFSPFIASEVKLTLMEIYPDDHKVCLVDAAGSEEEQTHWIKLYELDRFEGVHNLRSLYVPPLSQDERVRSFETLQYYIDAITDEEGDVWVNQQTHQSLLPYLKEETQELIEAFEKEDIDNVVEELGDVLMQVLYHTNLGEKSGWFSLEEVLESINRKLRRRHPHVFDGVEAKTVEEVDALWQQIKAEEKRGKDHEAR